jgi:hypothetical protein
MLSDHRVIDVALADDLRRMVGHTRSRGAGLASRVGLGMPIHTLDRRARELLW